MTALHRACWRAHRYRSKPYYDHRDEGYDAYATVQLFMEAGASPNLPALCNRETPLQYAWMRYQAVSSAKLRRTPRPPLASRGSLGLRSGPVRSQLPPGAGMTASSSRRARSFATSHGGRGGKSESGTWEEQVGWRWAEGERAQG